jgi:hypothetical protein
MHPLPFFVGERSLPREGVEIMMSGPDEERTVELDEDLEILPDSTSDERDIGWGVRSEAEDDDRYERPPHWA